MTIYQLRYKLARWEVGREGTEERVRWTHKGEARAYAEGISTAGLDAGIFRRGPGRGHPFTYYPAGCFAAPTNTR